MGREGRKEKEGGREGGKERGEVGEVEQDKEEDG